jgi:hypothetical protein
MRIDRKEFIEELMLREYISSKLKKIMNERQAGGRKQEAELRSHIRRILKEAEDAEKAPHSSTGINVLADILKKIIPVIEDDYKRLTTDPTQRESFRAHIINAAQNSIAPIAATSDKEDEAAPDVDFEPEEELSDDEMLELEAIEVVTGDEAEAIEDGGDDAEGIGVDDEGEVDVDPEGFIDIDDAPAEDEEDTFGIEGKDDTGRNFAQATFDKIEKQIIDAYALLGADEDKELFYSYLVTNLKLYFDRFEDELVATLPEPTTPEYEDEKGEQEDADAEGEEAEAEGGEDDDELDLDGDEELEL